MKMKKQFLGILLSLVMVLGLMPGMGMTAYANSTYTGAVKVQLDFTRHFKSNNKTVDRKNTLRNSSLPYSFSVSRIDPTYGWSDGTIDSMNVESGTNVTVDMATKNISINGLGVSTINVIHNAGDGDTTTFAELLR